MLIRLHNQLASEQTPVLVSDSGKSNSFASCFAQAASTAASTDTCEDEQFAQINRIDH